MSDAAAVDAPAVDAAEGPDAAPLACGTIALIADDFADDAVDQRLWETRPAPPSPSMPAGAATICAAARSASR